MDLRNVVFAIALSFAVLFGWSVIFETPQIEEQKKQELSKNCNENGHTRYTMLGTAWFYGPSPLG